MNPVQPHRTIPCVVVSTTSKKSEPVSITSDDNKTQSEELPEDEKEEKVSDEVKISIYKSKRDSTIVLGILCFGLLVLSGGQHGVGWFILGLMFIW